MVGWCSGAGYTSSAGASYNLDYSRARAYCACSRSGWGLFGHFYSPLSFWGKGRSGGAMVLGKLPVRGRPTIWITVVQWGGAVLLGKLPVPERPTIWNTVGQGPTALAVEAGGGCLDIFTLIYHFFPLSPSLW